MKELLVLALIAANCCAQLANGAPTNCTRRLARADACVARAMIVTDPQLRIYADEQDLDSSYCQ